MKTITILTRIYTIVFFLFEGTLFMNAQLHDTCTISYWFFNTSSDIFHYKGKKYLMERSPLDFFEGYKKLYPEVPEIRGDISIDKNYSVEWLLLDSVLYLTNIKFGNFLQGKTDEIKKVYPNYEHFTRIEDLTHEKFIKYKYPGGFNYMPNPKGMLEASWINDIFYIKRFWNFEHNEPYESWKAASSYRLIFKEGKLISITEVPALLFTGVLYFPRPGEKGRFDRHELINGKVVSKTITNKGKKTELPRYMKINN